jgi:hypothetical protein
MLDKVSKTIVNYSRGDREAHCGRAFDGDKGSCRHFIETKSGGNLGTCERVSGTISRLMWCRLFARAQVQ